MVRSRKAESNVLAEIMMVGIAVTLSTVVFFGLRGSDSAGGFGSLIGTFEAPSEILSVNGLSQKCPGTDASVAVKNTGGLDANVKSVAINDATINTNVNAKYPSTATSFSIVSGSTSDPVDKSRCNDSSYFNIASAFSGTTMPNVVSNSNFNSDITGWTSSSSVSTPLTRFNLTMFVPLTDPWNGNQDYRKLCLCPDNADPAATINFGNKDDKKFWFDPGDGNPNTGNPNNDPKGFGWRTENPLNAVIAANTWEFGLKLRAVNIVENTEGHIEIYVYSADPTDQNLNNADLLFSLDTTTDVLVNNGGQPYVFTHNPGLQFNLSGKVLIVEYWLHIEDDDNNSANNADLVLIIDSNSYVKVPIIPTISAVVWDNTSGNTSPGGSGVGSAKGVVTDATTYAAIGTVNYNFITQFTTPAQFNSMTANYAWSYSVLPVLTDTKLNFARLIITDLNDNFVTELHCDDNGSGPRNCGDGPDWTSTLISFQYRTGIASNYALAPSTSYKLVVQFQVTNNAAADLPVITLNIDDVSLQFIDGNYQAITTFNGTSDPTLNPSNIKLYFDSTFTQPSVSVTLQGYDYTISNYSTTIGQQSYTFATPSSDYIISMDLDPSKFLSNGNWQVKVTATHSIPFTMSIDLLQLNAISSKPVLREVVYTQNIVISPGQTVLVNATLSRTLDADMSYKVTIVTERNSYSTVILN